MSGGIMLMMTVECKPYVVKLPSYLQRVIKFDWHIANVKYYGKYLPCI